MTQHSFMIPVKRVTFHRAIQKWEHWLRVAPCETDWSSAIQYVAHRNDLLYAQAIYYPGGRIEYELREEYLDALMKQRSSVHGRTPQISRCAHTEPPG